jgi:hypothetical protein
VLAGPLTVSGRVHGSVVVVNGDAVLRPGARIDGDLLVVGGVVEGRGEGVVGGEVRWYGDSLVYHQEGGRLVADGDGPEELTRFGRWVRRPEPTGSHLRLRTQGAYNRVEGLPILFGPTFRQRTRWGELRVDAVRVLRTARTFKWETDHLGHDVGAEVQPGRIRGLVVGGRAFNLVGTVQSWQLKDSEVGLASFFLHRDFRDYYDRHGAQGYVRVGVGRASLRMGYGGERWGSLSVRDPFTLLRNGDRWRPNPAMDDGWLRLATAGLRIDTRNDVQDPWIGWLITADVEHGASRALRLAPSSFGVRGTSAGGCGATRPCGPAVAGPIAYTRGFVDVRRYNRISADGQLNLRLVLDGWLGGDPLPLERRVSLGGPGTLPGFGFRDRGDGRADVLTCSVPLPVTPAGAPRSTSGSPPEGVPAECERLALGQVEYRGSLRISIGDDWPDEKVDGKQRRRGWFHFDYHRVGQWVVFADAGRGWLVHTSGATTVPSTLSVRPGGLPRLGSFHTDVGAGLDFAVIGFFVAKATSDVRQPATFFVRLRHRF